MSLSRLVVQELVNKTGRKTGLTAETKLRQDLALFDRISRMGKKIDSVEAVREERNRDND